MERGSFKCAKSKSNDSMLQEHQSYEDFQLDALIQYDLTDGEDGSRSENDLASALSDGLDEVEFNKLYESTPCMVYDVDEPIHSSFREMTKRLASPNRKTSGDAEYERKSGSVALRGAPTNETRGTIVRRHSMGSTPEEKRQTIRQRDSLFRVFQIFQRLKVKGKIAERKRASVERVKSTRTQETTAFDQSITDDALEVYGKNCLNDSVSSICYLVDDNLSEVLADECVDILNDSISAITNGKYDDDSVSTITNGHCDNLLSKLEDMVNHSKHHRSVPIIDTRSMEFLNEEKKPRGRSMSNYPYMKIDL